MSGMQFDDIPDRRGDDVSLLRKIQLVQLRLLQIVDRLCRKHDIPYWIDFGTLLGAVRHGGFIPWDDDLDIAMTREDYRRFIALAAEELPASVFLQTAQTDHWYDINTVPAKIRDCGSTMIEKPDGKFHQGIYIDIFPYDRTFFDRKLRRLHQRIFTVFVTGFQGNFFSTRPWYQDFRATRKKILAAVYHFIPARHVEMLVSGMWKLSGDWCWRPTLSSKYDDAVASEKEMFPLVPISFEDFSTFAPSMPEEHLVALYGNWRELPPVEKRIPSHTRFADPEKPWSA